MKISLRTTASLVLLAGSLVLLETGCAGTATRESTGEFIDDTAVSAKVKTEFARDQSVRARDVQVETFKGVVQLSGFVDTAEQKSRAAEIARSVAGVVDVKNNITVKTATNP